MSKMAPIFTVEKHFLLVLLLKFVCILQALYSICNSYLSNGCYEGLFSLSVGQQSLSGRNSTSLWFRLSTRVCVCARAQSYVCHRKLQVCLSPWGRWATARSAGYRREGKTLGFNTDTNTCALKHTRAQKYTILPPGPPELTDASCPAAKSTELHTHKHTHTAWPWHPYRLTQRPL